MMNSVRDHLHSDKKWTTITSGSFGEGLGMKGSDLDIMTVAKLIEICENTHMNLNADKIHFTMEMVDTEPGFTKLRLMHNSDQSIIEFCAEIGSEFYFSNHLFKQALSTDILSTVHGPCVSDERGSFDLAYCLYSKLWITPAKQWITRSNHSWPRYDVKQDIVNHGVLFVPVGVKGSAQEELEWRISFSVGEKLLIHTFTHTQLLCYALMKIIQKDVISLDIDCKELICSYFMKTVLFWICEELPPSEWKPENLISCYMRCFRRLIYCVKYGVCPHYFIPENNLFENKIQGQAQKTLLNKLNILNSYGWQCILLSDQFSEFRGSSFDVRKQADYVHVSSVEKLLTNTMFEADIFQLQCYFLLEKVIHKNICNRIEIQPNSMRRSLPMFKSGKFIMTSHFKETNKNRGNSITPNEQELVY
ncbi:uncharacterized protein LOC127713977 [Mytilus californianus]|uniref:uncharacterized protein LOC127713977 n=1 Tax=Mytilus californianus TaxID=6549 RepID=UPI002246D40F|nr:uncharacterized protein LOC127713977 [Mytilus californianus]